MITKEECEHLFGIKGTEKEIENRFVEWCDARGVLALKLVLLTQKGFPDRTVLIPGGKTVFIEFKKKGKKLNPLQNKRKKTLEAVGFDYFVCDEIGQAESIVEGYL